MFTTNHLIQLEKLGYIGPIDFLTNDEVKNLKEKILNYKRWIFESGFVLNQVLASGAAITHKKELINFLIKYFSDDVVSLGSRPFLGGGEPGKAIPWHHEMDFGRIFGNDTSGVQTWLTLDDADVNNGALQVIPGSHKLSELDPINIYGLDVFSKKENLHNYSIQFLKSKLEKNNFEITTFKSKPGQLYLFHWKLLHRTAPYNKFSERRLTINSRYVSKSENFNNDWCNKNARFVCSNNKIYNRDLLKMKYSDIVYSKYVHSFKTIYKKILKKVIN